MNIYVTFPPGVAHFINVCDSNSGNIVKRKHCLDDKCVLVFDYDPEKYTYNCLEKLIYSSFESYYVHWFREDQWVHSRIAMFENGYVEVTEKEYFSVWATEIGLIG